MKKITNVLWGIGFILLGIIWALNEMEYTKINILFNGWWTLFIIIPCFTGIFQEKNKIGNLIGLLIGIIILLLIQNIISLNLIMKLLIPIIFISIGIGIIFNDFTNKKTNKKIKELNKNLKEEYYATFSNLKTKIPKENFKGANLNSIFGKIDFDLTDSIIEKEQVINTTSIFGGITIKVPKNVNIKIKSTAIFGGIENKINQKEDDKLPMLYINNFCLFGGIEIK